MSESELYADIILEATRLGHRLFRNQVGRAKYKSAKGQVYTVPYGVGGPGGSDLIGWRKLLITPQMVGMTIAQLVASEVKGPRGSLTDEQEMFLDAVLTAGGVAGVVRSVEDYRRLVGAE